MLVALVLIFVILYVYDFPPILLLNNTQSLAMSRVKDFINLEIYKEESVEKSDNGDELINSMDTLEFLDNKESYKKSDVEAINIDLKDLL